MGLIFPDPPTPPNPVLTAGLQTASNINTAVGSAYLSNVNQYTPQGNLEFSNGPGYSWTDPSGISWNVPTFNVTQSDPWWTTQPGPSGTSMVDNNRAVQYNLSQTGRQRSYDLMNMPVNFDPLTGAPQTGDLSWLETPYAQDRLFNPVPGQQYNFADVGQQQREFGDAGAITRSYGPQDSFSADRSRVEDALFQRMNPQLLQDEDRLRQQLADQGIRYGTPAYDNAMRNLTSQRTDARLAVTAAGGQEQQRMMDMAAQQAGFQNAAQQQAYTQALGRGTFANEAQQQAYLQAQQRGQFYNQAQRDTFQQEAAQAELFNAAQAQNLARNTSLFNAANAQRNQYLAEQYQRRAQPLNEINALQTGAQLQQPNFVNAGGQQIANTDVAGIINNRFSQEMDITRQENQNINNIIGGLFGLAGAGVKASDRRVKKNIHRVGTVYAARKHDEDAKRLPFYEYGYKDDPSATRHVGPMAQDVERIDPGAVVEIGGVKHIKPRRVLGDILKVA